VGGAHARVGGAHARGWSLAPASPRLFVASDGRRAAGRGEGGGLTYFYQRL